jgi:hypothetical protein
LGVTFTPTSAIARTKNIQYFPESALGTYTIGANTFAQIGFVTRVNHSFTQQHKETRIVGSRLLYSDRAQLKEGTLDLTWEFGDIGTKFAKYAIDQPSGTPLTPGCDIPLLILETAKINGVESYRCYEDCLTDRISFAIEKDIVMTQNMTFSNLTKWMTLSELRTVLGIAGTGAVPFASALTGDAWNHLDSTMSNTGSPLTVDGNQFFNLRLTVEVNNNITKILPGGWDIYYWAAPQNESTTGTLTTWETDGIELQNHVKDFDAADIIYKIKEAGGTATDVTLTVPGAHFNAESDSTEAGANDFTTLDLPFTGQTCQITTYP